MATFFVQHKAAIEKEDIEGDIGLRNVKNKTVILTLNVFKKVVTF